MWGGRYVNELQGEESFHNVYTYPIFRSSTLNISVLSIVKLGEKVPQSYDDSEIHQISKKFECPEVWGTPGDLLQNKR